jgi:hypothetical protein
LLFAAKIIAVVAIANGLGMAIYFAGSNRGDDSEREVAPPTGS